MPFAETGAGDRRDPELFSDHGGGLHGAGQIAGVYAVEVFVRQTERRAPGLPQTVFGKAADALALKDSGQIFQCFAVADQGEIRAVAHGVLPISFRGQAFAAFAHSMPNSRMRF